MEPKPIVELRCYDNFLFCMNIQEQQGEIVETIGHMTVCARRFMTRKPDFITDPIKSREFSLPECAGCCRELTSFKKDIKVDFKKTKRTKGQIQKWITDQVRRGCRNFHYDPLNPDKTKMLPMPGVPLFNPDAAPDYDPDQFIQGKGSDVTF